MNTKKSIFSTKTVVATALGAALFMVLFMFVKIPSPVPETSIQPAYGVAAFFGALFGPLCGGLVAFVGHALTDFISYGSPWWSWVIASGAAGAIAGVSYFMLDIEEGKFEVSDMVKFNVIQAIAHAIAWIVVAPVLDIVMYAEPVNVVFLQGAWAFAGNVITTAVVGTLLLKVYASTRVGKSTLNKE